MKMWSRRRIIIAFASAGLLVPLFFFSLAKVFEMRGWDSTSLSTPALLLWPTSLVFLASSTRGGQGLELELLAISTVMNVALYAGLGMFVWIGLRRRYVLYAVGTVIVLVWLGLLSL